MASTSLSDQLKKLSTPQTSIYKDDKKRVSLLFDPKEAALKDRDTFYDIGVSGLNELISLYEGFRVYEDSLFSVTSKDFERAVQTKEVNANLDQTIEKFLLELSPYMLLQSSHKALEWLVNRYYIHDYNQDAIIALILPYHETKIFIRFVQIMDTSSKSWKWLEPVKANGIPLTKLVLHKQCISNTSTLHFIARSTLKHVTQFGERANQLNTVIAFFCSTAIGCMHTVTSISEAMINALLPTLISALDSQIADFRASSYIIFGYLMTKAKLKIKTINEIIEKLFTSEFELTQDVVLLINLIYTNQKHVTQMSEFVISNITTDLLATFCEHLKVLIKGKIDVLPFVLAFLSGVLAQIQEGTEEFMMFSKHPNILLDELDLRKQKPEKVIQCVLNSWMSQKTETTQDDSSDLEIISDDHDFQCKLLEWYSLFFKDIESKYPDAFDKVVKKEMASENKERKARFSKVLSFNPAIAHKIGGAYLFENLNHANPEVRRGAVTFIAKEFESFQIKSKEFVKESIINRFHDDDPGVVKEVLSIDADLNKLLDDMEITDVLTHILSQTSKSWKSVVKLAIVKICNLNILPVNTDTVIALIPFLFPANQSSATITWNIISSPWGAKAGLKDKLPYNHAIADNAEVLSQMMFKALFEDQSVNFMDILDITRVNKDRTLDLVFYLLLKTCSIQQAPIQDVVSILDLLLESVNNRTIMSSEISNVFNSETIRELIMIARHDEILFEMLDFIFDKIIRKLTPRDATKPWCNVCVNPSNILVRRLFELFVTGCGIQGYSDTYQKLLQKLFRQLFKTAKEKFEFVANVACGHVLYAENPKNLVSPVLQLRSLKLLNSFIVVQNSETWLYDSDVLIVTILFCLNHPIKSIRVAVLELVDMILQDVKGNTIYVHFLKEVMEHKGEMLMDHEQIAQIMRKILTQQTVGNKVFKKNCMLKLTGILIGETPAHIKSNLVRLLSGINNSNMFSHIALSLRTLLNPLKSSGRVAFDIYESNLFTNVISQINETTVTAIAREDVWKILEAYLKEYRECIIQEDMTFTSPSIIIMRELSENVYANAPAEKCKDLIYLITSAGAFSNNPSISSAAAKTMKKIKIKLLDFKAILEKMINVKDPAENVAKKKKSSMSMISYQVVETDEWRLGLTLLEYVQNKKKMVLDNTYVTTLFQLLNKCLRFEEQSYVEYTKQLILSSLWYYCKAHMDGKDEDQVRELKSIFDVELVVQCIRGTQNPQTHHHSLILLSQAAQILPEQVLHHIMEIFTFIGSSVLRHDDAYSFQIITKIVETLIPILVKMNKNISDYTKKELEQLHKRVVPVLRIFADVVLDVPEHRRLPLYKKLIETLGANEFLWVFLALLLETHIAHFGDKKKKDNASANHNVADKEAPINRLDFGQSIVLEFPPEIVLENFIKLTMYMKSLPLLKDDDTMDTTVDPSDIFSVNGHSAIQLRHYKYVFVTFLNNCLSLARFVEQCSQATDIPTMESHYKSFVINILTFIQSITKIKDEKTAKYWRVMLHHSYDLLDHINNLLSAPMFLSVVRGLLLHTLPTVQRKAMELLNLKIQCSPEMFDNVDKTLMFSLLPSLLRIVKTIGTGVENVDEADLNQQTALLTLKLLTRMSAQKDPEEFQQVLEVVTDYTCSADIPPNVMASIVLCLAELCANLKAYCLNSLRKFMPALIKVLKKQRESETPELVLLSTVTAISKIVESMPLFLSPYLKKIIYEYSLLLAKWLAHDQDNNKVSAIVTKLQTIKKKIASSIPPRVMIPVANETHGLIIKKQKYEAVGPVMAVLADSFANVTTADFTALQQDLTLFFITALQLRCDAGKHDVDESIIDNAEDKVVKALVSLVLKLSETSFRPFYFKIYDWAIRTNIEGQKDRAITFYRLSSAIADKLKGLFVLFVGHFIKNAADLLDACNNSKTEQLYFESDNKCLDLIKYILKTLHTVFLYDSQSFINKGRFETLMQPVVDQLENTLGGISDLQTRAKKIIIPCISQFAVTIGDDSLWKLLNYQVLLKTRHNDAEIRLIALDCLVDMATQLGSNWLPLLAESVPFLAELLEDGDQRIEVATKNAVRTLEQILGEPLEKYF
ncbi:unnamed protein product [Leptosia nina]|uniref:HEAT repeat-containing protein 1 n=1 Tax=Leptosia nina TaxID=320188 RepID=A0AAV1JM58_9NEOP